MMVGLCYRRWDARSKRLTDLRKVQSNWLRKAKLKNGSGSLSIQFNFTIGAVSVEGLEPTYANSVCVGFVSGLMLCAEKCLA